MKVFDAGEVLQFAVRIEEIGENFYRKLAEKADKEEIKSLFNYLANEEIVHKKIFSDMLSTVEKYEPPENYPGEYFSYLRAYADSQIFDEKAFEEVNTVKGFLSALDFAIRRELDSILFYEELKKYVPSNQHHIIDRVIGEERKHFQDLMNIRNAVTGERESKREA